MLVIGGGPLVVEHWVDEGPGGGAGNLQVLAAFVAEGLVELWALLLAGDADPIEFQVGSQQEQQREEQPERQEYEAWSSGIGGKAGQEKEQ